MPQDTSGFLQTLRAHGLELRKAVPDTLQVNTGYLCNLACRHCHLEAGPGRGEVMGRAVMEDVLACARRIPFATVDVTGGAPEMVPDIGFLLEGLAPLAPRRMFRTNLLALRDNMALLDTLVSGGWTLAASLPAVSAGQVEAMRGPGVFEASMEMLRVLNDAGYASPGSPLELHLVANPSGAFMPPEQQAAQKHFQRELPRRYGVHFTSLFVFANVPLGRFRSWLARSGNLEGYARSLRERFNPAVVPGLMCRTLVSVAWDGTLYDCDFNQAAGLPAMPSRRVSELSQDLAGGDIPTGDHCFACTAGSGFT
jgi:radical SAM/Cys-rich protein